MFSTVATLVRKTFSVLLLSLPMLVAPASSRAQDAAPHLEKHGDVTQLIVDGKPMLLLSGELLNSSPSSLDYMKPIWPRLAAMGLNTVITPVTWELVEPTEGTYDFTLVDGLLAQAREQHERIIFLWLAAWKNGVSSYPPLWVKRDTKRFPRVVEGGNEINTLSTLSTVSNATRDADATAFAALMQHIRQVDSLHTVLMMQVENEVGVLGNARDHSPAADKAFASPVPKELMHYLAVHRATLDPELQQLLQENGDKTAGTWAEVFASSDHTGDRADEAFMAWNYALYVQAVATRGKAAYNIPMYVNTWLPGDHDKPGNYPSGGPLPRVIDIWKAAGISLASEKTKGGPALDIYAPDLYAADFTGWSKRYHRDGNPLFMPETNSGEAGAANVFYAVGEHAAICFSPFAIDIPHRDEKDPLGASYQTIAEIAPIILAAQGATGSANPDSANTHGFLLTKEHPSINFVMQGNTIEVSLDEIFGHHSESGFGLIVATGPDQFLGAGKGFRVRVNPPANTNTHIGLGTVDEGHYVDGRWQQGRRLNGDETDQGNYWRFDQRTLHIEKAAFYHYE